MSSIRRIVCGTELREEDQPIVDQAARLCAVLGAELILAHAGAPPPAGASDVPASMQAAAQLLAERVSVVIDRDAEMLEHEAARRRRDGCSVRGVQMPGRPHEVLIALADATDDALLVVGIAPDRRAGRTVDQVVRHARSPVLACPRGAPAILRGLEIAVAFDASEASGRALTLAWELASRLGGTLALVHVCAPADVSESRERFQAMLMSQRPELVPHTSIVIAVAETTVAEAVIRAASEQGATMIVMGSHARRGFARAIFGSTSEAVLHHAATSVMVVR